LSNEIILENIVKLAKLGKKMSIRCL
jgi:hypothetical protein